MTYPECLEYLYQQLPMYQRVGKAAYKADLGTTHALMDVLEHPYRGFKSVHIAGTNGKGSVSHMLASIFQEAGYKTGLYTSPHLVDFRERIRINGLMIPEEDVVDFVEHYQADFEQLGLSFFEWTVGLAFAHFKKQQVDIAIVEVGMGGRLDSTNVITPELSVITNIGMDHQQFLGNTLAKIAGEKGGIIKPGVPVVVGRRQDETVPVFEALADEHDNVLHFADDLETSPLASGLRGNYQAENTHTVQIAAWLLDKRGWMLSDTAIEKGLAKVISNTGLRGRWETLQEHPKVICDVGHNQDGVQQIVAQLAKEQAPHLHLVLGFVSDKDVADVLALFPAGSKVSYYLCQASIPRAMPVEQLALLADQLQLNYSAHTTVKDAYDAALHASSREDVVFVGGSTFVVADLLFELAE